MLKLFKGLFWTFVAVTVISVAMGGWLAHEVFDAARGAGDWQVVIDDEVIHTDMDATSSAVALGVGGVLVVALVAVLVFVVLPLVLLLGVGLPILALLCALASVVAALAGASAVLFSPLLLPLLLVVWLVRRKARPAPTVSTPTVRA